jgi:hypothetical protein
VHTIGHLPTLWDPEDLFTHLALWAGAPAIGVAVVVALLAFYNAVKSWIEFGRSAADAATNVRRKAFDWTTAQQRAIARLVLMSVLTVTFSYMLAEIIDIVAQMCEKNTSGSFTFSYFQDTAVAVTPWPPAVVWTVVLEVAGIGLLGITSMAELDGLRKLITFLGGVLCAAAWLAGVALGLITALNALDVLLGSYPAGADNSPNVPPVPLVVTATITAALCLALARFLPRLKEASAEAFGSGGSAAGYPYSSP